MEARVEAAKRMGYDAANKGANAIVNVRFNSGSITEQASEVHAYGTAVRVKRRA